MKLMLCAGETRREGWHTLDADPQHGPNFIATVPPLPSVVSAIQWEAVELIHGISSFYPWEAKRLLLDLRRALAPEGVLILEQPDIAKAMGSGVIRWVFGDPSYEAEGYMNKWGYTPESLSAELREAGFTRVELKPAVYHHPPRDFRIEARP